MTVGRSKRGRLLSIVVGLIAIIAVGAPAAASEIEFQSICRLVDGAALANRLPPAFLARILWQESRLRSDATSRAGAAGIAQFMPRTALEHGLLDPRQIAPATIQAARFLADLRVRFGNLGLAAAAYNAGAGRVANWLHGQSDLPAESRRYVASVTGYAAEQWRDSRSDHPIAGAPSCDQAIAELAGTIARPAATAPTQPAPRLAVVLAASTPRAAPAVVPESERAAHHLCEAIRTLGLKCTVY